MRKIYHNEGIDTCQPTVPDTVSVALAELAGEMREGLLALAVGTGLQVMAAIMEEDVTAACGPKGRHDPDRMAVRHGHERGSVSLGGRRVPVTRPRMRAADGSGELAVPSYELFSSTEILGRMAMDRMLGGLSTRRYPVGLEPVGTRAERSATATSKSAVSRRFVAQTETADEFRFWHTEGVRCESVVLRRCTGGSTSSPPLEQRRAGRARARATRPRRRAACSAGPVAPGSWASPVPR